MVASMTNVWEVKSSAFPGVSMFYLHLTQTSTGVVSGDIRSIITGAKFGETDPAAPGRIDAQGRLTSLRLKFHGGADVTINGQMQPNGYEVVGSFSGNATLNGVQLDGMPVTLEID
jgi:hypothetical protein